MEQDANYKKKVRCRHIVSISKKIFAKVNISQLYNLQYLHLHCYFAMFQMLTGSLM